MYEIRDDIPIPTTRYSKYNLADLKIGSSIAVPRDEALRLKAAAYAYKTRHKDAFNFVTRTRIEDNKEVFRLWRVEIKEKEAEKAVTMLALAARSSSL